MPRLFRHVSGVFGCVLGRVGSLVGGFIDTVFGFLCDLLGAVFRIFGCVLGGVRSFVGCLVRGMGCFLGYLLGSVGCVFGCVLGSVRSLVGRLVDVGFDVLRVGERGQAEQHR